jgi:two-component system OmpR family response regulator
MARILVVDDDKNQLENVEDWLLHEHHTVETAESAEQAEELLKAYQYDLLIFDWSMPQMSGVELLKRFRAAGGVTPVMMLTGKEGLDDKEQGLDAGADDYLTKPFHLKELSARIRALLRRPKETLSNVLRAGDIEMDTATFRTTRGGKPIELLPKEYAVLQFLMRHPNQVFDAQAILDRVWNSEQQVGPETVKTTILRLRKKIDEDRDESIIKSTRGIGYKIET